MLSDLEQALVRLETATDPDTRVMACRTAMSVARAAAEALSAAAGPEFLPAYTMAAWAASATSRALASASPPGATAIEISGVREPVPVVDEHLADRLAALAAATCAVLADLARTAGTADAVIYLRAGEHAGQLQDAVWSG